MKKQAEREEDTFGEALRAGVGIGRGLQGKIRYGERQIQEGDRVTRKGSQAVCLFSH